MNFHFGMWDLILLVLVSVEATIVAYLYLPKWKAFVLCLPLPFTVASLSLGKQIGVFNVLGLMNLFIYTFLVYLLHKRCKLHIFATILICVAVYCTVGTSVARIVPGDDLWFWISCIGVIIWAAVFYVNLPHIEEQGHRSKLPVWIKLPLVTLLVFGLVVMKNSLQGFMTVFPMVGVFTSYEARHSLYTSARQITLMMMAMVPLMIAAHVTYPVFGLSWSLLAGWSAFLAAFIPMTLWQAKHAQM